MRKVYKRLYDWFDHLDEGKWFAFCIVAGFLTSQVIRAFLGRGDEER